MEMSSGSLLSTLLALAAFFLGLSLFVQVLQEIYKFLTSSKSHAYMLLLSDFLGPWTSVLQQPANMADLKIRGPFQFLRRRPTGKLLPLEKDDLIEAMERAAPEWHRRVIKYLRVESVLQQGTPQPASPSWLTFLTLLDAATHQPTPVEKAEKEDVFASPGYWNALEVKRFLEKWGQPVEGAVPGESETGVPSEEQALPTLDAEKLLRAFRETFLGHVVEVDEHYSQLMRNFNYRYQRRNLRQTFIIALLVALLFNLPLQQLYRRASSLSPDEALALADRTFELYQTYQDQTRGTSTANRNTAAPEAGDAGGNDPGSGADVDTTNAGTTADGADQAAGQDQAAGLPPDSIFIALQETLGDVQELLAEALQESGGRTEFAFVGWPFYRNLLREGGPDVLLYILGCLLTTLLVCFGAPFWNDLAGSLTRLQRERRAQPKSLSTGGEHAWED